MSGNGIRCLAQAAVEAGLVTPPVFTVSTLAGIRTVEYRPGETPGSARASVDMGEAVLGPDQPQQFADRRARQVDMGNPHLVLLGPDPAGVDVAELGSRLQEVHPGGINVEFISVGPGADGHRPSGYGSAGWGRPRPAAPGSAAAAAAARSWGLVGETVAVHNPGGTLQVSWAPRGVAEGPGPQGGRDRCGPAGDPGGGPAVTPTDSAFTDTLISRTVRERIVLVGVTLPHDHGWPTPRPGSTSWPCWWPRPAPT